MGGRMAELAAGVEPRFEQGGCEDADYVLVAYGTPGRIVRYVAEKMRREGVKVGFFRPVTLYPFPAQALVDATRSTRTIGVYELNAGQMIDDVRLSVGDRRIEFIGGISFDDSGFGIGPELTPAKVEARIRAAMASARAEQTA
jgi:2-oxoglutarate ferredoxin oxidoreductase subunit alpha